MGARPAIVIGLGSSGSEVAVEVYKNYKKYLAANPGEKQDLIQFILIDSNVPGPDAKELVANRRALPVGDPNGDALYDEMNKRDPFFRVWWPDGFSNVGPMWPGCSTISIKGRLAFWARLGLEHGGSSFFNLLQSCWQRAAAAARGFDEQRPWVPIYIITTICGGTGAGMALDIAYMARKMEENLTNAEIHGIFMMPSVPILRAEIQFHQHIKANGYGFLVALNHWMTAESQRKVKITPFMNRKNFIFEGKKSPFNVSWLISATNKDNFSLLDWNSIKMHLSVSITAMLFEKTATYQGKLNDLVMDTQVSKTENGQPWSYGSLASYALRYQPEKTAEYLANYYGQKAISAFKESNPAGLEIVKKLATDFMLNRHIREKSEDGSGQALDEVINRLELIQANKRKVDDDINIDERLMKVKKNEESLLGELKTLRSEETARLTIHDPTKPGVCFIENLEANASELSDETLNVRQAKKATISGLYQMVEWILEDYSDGLGRAESFLNELTAAITIHRADLLHELNGDPDAGQEGELKQLTDLEMDEPLEQLARIAAKIMFVGLLADRKKGIELIKKRFWTEWLDLKKNVMAKQQAVAFYDTMVRAIADLKTNLTERVRKDLDMASTLMSSSGKEAFGRRLGVREAVLEDLVLQEEQTLLNAFADVQTNNPSAGREIVAAHVIQYLVDIRGKKAPQEVEMIRQKFRKDLKEELVQMGVIVFKGPAEALSLWDALKKEADYNKQDVVAYIQKKVNGVIHKCVPYWPINVQGLLSEGTEPKPLTLIAMDLKALQDFEDQNHLDLQLDSIEDDANSSELRGSSDLAESKYEISVFKAEAGAPLYMHHEVNAIEHDFAAWHNARMSIPVILDKRLEELFEVTNKKPFDIDTEDPYEEVEYYFLVSENMGIITTPLNSSEYTNTFGKHLFGAKPIKDGSRRDAIKALQPNGPAEKIMEDVTVLVLKAWKKKGEDDKKRILADAYSKLNGAAKTSPGAYKALLLAEADLIARRAASEFKMSLDELVDLAGEA